MEEAEKSYCRKFLEGIAENKYWSLLLRLGPKLLKEVGYIDPDVAIEAATDKCYEVIDLLTEHSLIEPVKRESTPSTVGYRNLLDILVYDGELNRATRLFHLIKTREDRGELRTAMVFSGLAVRLGIARILIRDFPGDAMPLDAIDGVFRYSDGRDDVAQITLNAFISYIDEIAPNPLSRNAEQLAELIAFAFQDCRRMPDGGIYNLARAFINSKLVQTSIGEILLNLIVRSERRAIRTLLSTISNKEPLNEAFRLAVVYRKAKIIKDLLTLGNGNIDPELLIEMYDDLDTTNELKEIIRKSNLYQDAIVVMDKNNDNTVDPLHVSPKKNDVNLSDKKFDMLDHIRALVVSMGRDPATIRISQPKPNSSATSADPEETKTKHKGSDVDDDDDETGSKKDCKVCMDANLEMMAEPCRHICCCNACLDKLKVKGKHETCPICQGAVSEWKKVFM